MSVAFATDRLGMIVHNVRRRGKVLPVKEVRYGDCRTVAQAGEGLAGSV